MNRNIFTYSGVKREVLKSAAVEKVESGGRDLTLFTFTVCGQRRVIIRCELEED